MSTFPIVYPHKADGSVPLPIEQLRKIKVVERIGLAFLQWLMPLMKKNVLSNEYICLSSCVEKLC